MTYICVWMIFTVVKQLRFFVLVTSDKISPLKTMKQNNVCQTRSCPGTFWRLFISFCAFDTCDSPQFVCDSNQPRWAGGRASGFSPRWVGVGRQVASGRVFLPPQRYPDSGEISLWRTKKKRGWIRGWKTLAFCEPDSGGEVPHFDSNLGGFCQERLEKCWEINWQRFRIAKNDAKNPLFQSHLTWWRNHLKRQRN